MIKPTPNPPISLFTVVDTLKTEDLLVNLTETIASADALMSDFAFELGTIIKLIGRGRSRPERLWALA